MDGIIEESVIQQLLSAIADGNAAVIVGVCLLIAVAITRAITRDRLDKPASDWVSATAALLAGVGLLLASGMAWLEAVLIGSLVLGSSRGVYELLGSLIPKKKGETEPAVDNGDIVVLNADGERLP